MSSEVKIATRDSYGKALLALGKNTDDVVVMDADLASATRTAVFQKEYPERFFDCGIAEGNMIGVAAGLSTMGLVPFVSTFAMFSAGRAFEQIRNCIGYPHLNVKICATHGGISVGADGASHQCCEDFALMRSIPGMTVMCPSDDVEARKMIQEAYEMEGPVYLRLGRSPVPVYHDEDYHFRIGKGEVVHEGRDLAIVVTGILVTEALKAARELAEEGIHVRVINMPTIKPLDEEILLMAAKECKYGIVTLEEHNIMGGLGEAVCGLLAEKYPVRVKRLGTNDQFGHSGIAEELLAQFGLDATHIADTVRKMTKA